MKIIAFAASNSRSSINGQVVAHAARLLEGNAAQDVDVEVLDLNDFEMPIYSVDREREDGIPAQARDFFDRIGAADAVLVSFAEHNGSYTVAYKNIFDWASRIDSKVWQGKPMVMLSTSPGAGGGATVLKTATAAAPFAGADLRASLSIPHFHDALDVEAGGLRDEDLRDQLVEALAALTDGSEVAQAA